MVQWLQLRSESEVRGEVEGVRSAFRLRLRMQGINSKMYQSQGDWDTRTCKFMNKTQMQPANREIGPSGGQASNTKS